jgi:rubredoxin
VSQQPYDIDDLRCGWCDSGASGRVTDKFLESIGWRKIGGKWVCPFCTGASPLFHMRDEEGEENP